jgi:hypothetical protein
MSLDTLAEELAATPQHSSSTPQDLRDTMFRRMAGVAYATFASINGRPKE